MLVSSYGEELYNETSSLQQMKIKRVIAKNQLILLQGCIHHNITPKSFQLKTPIKSKKAFNVMTECSKRLIIIAKNNAKERKHAATLKVKKLCQNLRTKLSEEFFKLVEKVTEKFKEKEFIKKKNHLIQKFNKLKENLHIKNNNKVRTNYVKTSIINLTNKDQKSLLNLGPNFVPSKKDIPFMDIITATEAIALNLEYHKNESDAESLRQNVSHILNKNINFKMKDNLTKT